jgi:hypothetical protein
MYIICSFVVGYQKIGNISEANTFQDMYPYTLHQNTTTTTSY